tara:strand:- start:6569 stop:8710 length:2142 start_codon:yes stop_codon:yes gene_type:complete
LLNWFDLAFGICWVKDHANNPTNPNSESAEKNPKLGNRIRKRKKLHICYNVKMKKKVAGYIKYILPIVLLGSCPTNSEAQNQSTSWELKVYNQPGLDQQLLEINALHPERYTAKESFITSFIDSVSSTGNTYDRKVDALLESIRSKVIYGKQRYDDYIIQTDTLKDKYPEFPLIRAGFYHGISDAYSKMGFHMKSLEYYKQGQEILKAAGLDKTLSYRRPGDFYTVSGFHEEAINDYRSGYYEHLKTDSLNQHYLGYLCNNIGVVFYRMDELDSSLHYYNKAKSHWLRAPIASEIPYLIALVEGNIASVYMKQQNYREAIPLLRKDVEESKNENIINAISSWLGLAKCYYNMGNNVKAKTYCDSADMNMIEENAGYTLLVDWYSTKAKVYRELGKDTEAFSFLNKLIELNEVRREKDKEIDLQRYSFIYDVHSKQTKIEELEIEKLRGEKATAELSRLQWIASSIIIFVLLLAAFITVVYMLQRKISRQLKEKKEQAESLLIIKETLLKEIHHRIKNNLQIISSILDIQNIGSTDEKVKQATTEVKNRVRSIAIIHKKLYETEDLVQIDIQSYLEDLSNELKQAFVSKNKDVSIVVSASDINFEIDTVVPLGLITTELVTNSFKYGFKDRSDGEISVSVFKQSDNTYKLEVKDNGIGLPKGFNVNESGSMGLELVRGLAWQLDGEFNMFEPEEGGSGFVVIFKNELEKRQQIV